MWDSSAFVLRLRPEMQTVSFLISDSVWEHPYSLKRSALPNIDYRVLRSQLLLTPTLKPVVIAKIHSPALCLCRGKNHARSRSRI